MYVKFQPFIINKYKRRKSTNTVILPMVDIRPKPWATHQSKCSFVPGQRDEPIVAVYSATSRGRVQLIYGGQPFIFEKKIKLSTLEEKKYWRCNQWWNQKCRSRVCTINDMVIPLNRYHTHEEIVKRKKRVRKNLIPPATAIANDKLIKPEEGYNAGQTTTITSAAGIGSIAGTGRGNLVVSSLGMHLKYEEIVADVTEIVEPSGVVMSKK